MQSSLLQPICSQLSKMSGKLDLQSLILNYRVEIEQGGDIGELLERFAFEIISHTQKNSVQSCCRDEKSSANAASAANATSVTSAASAPYDENKEDQTNALNMIADILTPDESIEDLTDGIVKFLSGMKKHIVIDLRNFSATSQIMWRSVQNFVDRLKKFFKNYSSTPMAFYLVLPFNIADGEAIRKAVEKQYLDAIRVAFPACMVFFLSIENMYAPMNSESDDIIAARLCIGIERLLLKTKRRMSMLESAAILLSNDRFYSSMVKKNCPENLYPKVKVTVTSHDMYFCGGEVDIATCRSWNTRMPVIQLVTERDKYFLKSERTESGWGYPISIRNFVDRRSCKEPLVAACTLEEAIEKFWKLNFSRFAQ